MVKERGTWASWSSELGVEGVAIASSWPSIEQQGSRALLRSALIRRTASSANATAEWVTGLLEGSGLDW